MDQEVLKTGVAIVTAIVGLAILSVLVSKNSNTLGLVQNLSTGLAQDISAATAPVTSGGFGMTPNYTFANSSTYA
jgi:hypothetical protein